MADSSKLVRVAYIGMLLGGVGKSSSLGVAGTCRPAEEVDSKPREVGV